jgi:hypothetical protein
MERRDLIKTGLCVMGGAWIGSGRSMAAGSEDAKPEKKRCTKMTPIERTYPLQLEPLWMQTYAGRLHWLESMLERLGKDATVAVWKAAFTATEDELLQKILASEWVPYPAEETPRQTADGLLDKFFASPVEGITKAEARRLVEMDPCIRMPRERFESLRVQREVTSYETCHLRFDGAARIAEEMLRQLGKEGELVAYDIVRAWRVERSPTEQQETAEILQEWAEFPATKERNMFTAGLDVVLVKSTETEVVMHSKKCEWARYFTERHPSVGYMMACSTDDVALRASNDSMRMQRTSTIMEGGKVCDFRVYVV